MKTVITTLFLLLASTSLGSSNYGGSGLLVSVEGMYMTSNLSLSTPSTSSSSTRTLADGAIGYRFQFPLILGGLYSYDNASTSSSSSSPTTDTYNSYGPFAGLDTGNFYLWGAYFVGSEYDSTNGSVKTAYTQGSGYQASIGYRFNITSRFTFCPQLSYRSLSYSQAQVGSAAATSNTLTSSGFLPYLGFTFTFGGSGGGGD